MVKLFSVQHVEFPPKTQSDERPRALSSKRIQPMLFQDIHKTTPCEKLFHPLNLSEVTRLHVYAIRPLFQLQWSICHQMSIFSSGPRFRYRFLLLPTSSSLWVDWFFPLPVSFSGLFLMHNSFAKRNQSAPQLHVPTSSYKKDMLLS